VLSLRKGETLLLSDCVVCIYCWQRRNMTFAIVAHKQNFNEGGKSLITKHGMDCTQPAICLTGNVLNGAFITYLNCTVCALTITCMYSISILNYTVAL